MIIPSIDLMGGQAVQLIGGKETEIEAGDPRPIAEQFRLAGDIAVIDLDAAMSQGSNEELIKDLLKLAPCRVGGGIRDVETAIKWLDAGAEKIILGTKAVPEILKELPKERVLAALDAVDGEVVVEGWREGTGESILERMRRIKDYVSGFLITFVENEGRMQGTKLDQVEKLVAAAAPARVCIAGGITTAEEIAELEELGADAQVGMALYTKKLDLADAITASLKTDRTDGLFPTTVCDERGVALGLAWSNKESLRRAVETKRGVYFSRSRNQLWEKGKTSGNTQELLAIDLDCDYDALKFTVKQTGAGFCHKEVYSCWGENTGLGNLERTLIERLNSAPEGSYTKRLFEEKGLLEAKITEEAKELNEASSREEIVHEAADLIYFAMTKLAKSGVSLSEVEKELDSRTLRVTRRLGNAK